MTSRQNTLRIKFSNQGDGSLAVTFPNAEIIETDEGPMMGFLCDANGAVFIGGSIIHAGFEVLEADNEDENGDINLTEE